MTLKVLREPPAEPLTGKGSMPDTLTAVLAAAHMWQMVKAHKGKSIP
jgi:hypothetical protein